MKFDYKILYRIKVAEVKRLKNFNKKATTSFHCRISYWEKRAKFLEQKMDSIELILDAK